MIHAGAVTVYSERAQMADCSSWADLAQGCSHDPVRSSAIRGGGTVPSLPVLEPLANAVDADLVVQVTPRAGVG